MVISLAALHAWLIRKDAMDYWHHGSGKHGNDQVKLESSPRDQSTPDADAYFDLKQPLP
jgi:argininosuccinate synthase